MPSQLELEMGDSSEPISASRPNDDTKPLSGWQRLGIIAILGVSLLWLSLFAISLWNFPWGANVVNTPEVDVTARYLAEGKNRLGLMTGEGELHRLECDPLAALCGYVKKHSPVALKVRLAGPKSGLSDLAMLSARDGDTVLMSEQEGQANLASLKNTCLGGIAASFVGVVICGLALRYKASPTADVA